MNNDPAYPAILPGPERPALAAWLPASPPTGPDEASSALASVTGVLWPGKWWILGCGLLCALAALTASYFQTPLYRAKTSLEIQDLNDNFLQMGDLQPVSKHSDSTEAYVQTEIEELTSTALLSRVAKQLQMPEDFTDKPPSRYQQLKLRLLAPGTSLDTPLEQAIAEARSSLDVAASRGSARIVNIQYTSPDPKFAAAFTNALAQNFVSRSIEMRIQSSERMGDWLLKQADSLRAKLQASEDELQRYGQAQGLLFTDEKNSVAEGKLKQLQGELSSAQADRISKQSKYELLSKASPEGLGQLTDNAGLREYESKLADGRQQLADAEALYTPNHYKVKELEARVAQMQASLAAARKEMIGQTVNEFEAAQRRESLLEGAYNQQAGLVSRQDAKASRYNILKGEVETNRQLYDSMLQKVKNVSIASAMHASNIAIFDPAEVPNHPFEPRPLLNGLIGMLGGLLISSLFFFLQHRWDRSLKTPGQVSTLLRIPELGAVPSIRMGIAPVRGASLPAGSSKTSSILPFNRTAAPAGDPAQDALASVVANSFRAILASLNVSSARAHSPHIITVTSARAKEGKTSTASNLALTLASVGKRVLLVDGDFVKPRLNKLFDLPESRGFSDLLLSKAGLAKAPLSDFVQKAPGTELSVMGVGTVRTQAWSLLYGGQLGEVFEELRRAYEVVIIDTPPVLDVADARLICRQADGVVLVCRAGTTDRESARMAVERLVSDGTRIFGTILNDFDPRGSRDYKGYYSYYGEPAAAPASSRPTRNWLR